MTILPLILCLKLGWAAESAGTSRLHKIIIGKDARISGYMLESALKPVFATAGYPFIYRPLPTRRLTYLTRTFRAEAGMGGLFHFS